MMEMKYEDYKVFDNLFDSYEREELHYYDKVFVFHQDFLINQFYQVVKTPLKYDYEEFNRFISNNNEKFKDMSLDIGDLLFSFMEASRKKEEQMLNEYNLDKLNDSEDGFRYSSKTLDTKQLINLLEGEFLFNVIDLESYLFGTNRWFVDSIIIEDEKEFKRDVWECAISRCSKEHFAKDLQIFLNDNKFWKTYYYNLKNVHDHDISERLMPLKNVIIATLKFRLNQKHLVLHFLEYCTKEFKDVKLLSMLEEEKNKINR